MICFLIVWYASALITLGCFASRFSRIMVFDLLFCILFGPLGGAIWIMEFLDFLSNLCEVKFNRSLWEKRND